MEPVPAVQVADQAGHFSDQRAFPAAKVAGSRASAAAGMASCSGSMPASSSTARKLCKRPHGPMYSAAAAAVRHRQAQRRARSRWCHSCKAGDQPRPGQSVASQPLPPRQAIMALQIDPRRRPSFHDPAARGAALLGVEAIGDGHVHDGVRASRSRRSCPSPAVHAAGGCRASGAARTMLIRRSSRCAGAGKTTGRGERGTGPAAAGTTAGQDRVAAGAWLTEIREQKAQHVARLKTAAAATQQVGQVRERPPLARPPPRLRSSTLPSTTPGAWFADAPALAGPHPRGGSSVPRACAGPRGPPHGSVGRAACAGPTTAVVRCRNSASPRSRTCSAAFRSAGTTPFAAAENASGQRRAGAASPTP